MLKLNAVYINKIKQYKDLNTSYVEVKQRGR